eukprot:8642285-Pyramimonas_sp.AAC.1
MVDAASRGLLGGRGGRARPRHPDLAASGEGEARARCSRWGPWLLRAVRWFSSSVGGHRASSPEL